MKELVVISGKGGTGKTSLAASLACLAGSVVLADCDVDAADLPLLLAPRIQERHDFSGGHKAAVDQSRCKQCGHCLTVCRFGAIEREPADAKQGRPTFRVNTLACEGCRVCVATCPSQAIDFNEHVNGQWFVSDTRLGPMVHARLGIAEGNSGKLVTLIRRRAREIAAAQRKDWIIADGSPGVGCPVIASLTGADLALIVTEPTPSGRHDLNRVLALADRLRIPARVCINKADIHSELSRQIQADTDQRGYACVGCLPYHESFTRAQLLHVPLVEFTAGEPTGRIKEMWRQIVYAAG